LEVFSWNRIPFKLLNIDSNFTYWYPFAELETRYVLNEILPEDANIIDIGANVGLISIALSIDKPDRKILAVEPSRIHSQNLRLNKQHLNLKNIWLIENPLSYRAGKYKGQIWESNGIKRIEPDHPYLTLDQVYLTWKPTNLALIKIDTDGYEFKILLGARTLLRSTKALWCIEQTTSKTIFSNLSVNLFMRFYGYVPIIKLDGENVVFVRRDAFSEVQKNIFRALEQMHPILLQNYPTSTSTLALISSDFKIDSNAPKSFRSSKVGFKYSSAKSHTNVLSLTAQVPTGFLYCSLPLVLIRGSLNVIVENLNTGDYYSREIYSHEKDRVTLTIPGEVKQLVRITLRTGVQRKGEVIWRN
jgi:FkbM family methyltransferase